MREIIINRPDLQTFRQRLGSFFIGLLSWTLWLYFLLPLFTLGGWLMGVKSLSDEIRWFGGYTSLLDLLILYGLIVLSIAVAWLIWSFCLSWLHNKRPCKAFLAVSTSELADRFHLDADVLEHAKSHKTVTVHFDENAEILFLEQK
ncbi:MAG: poly-beta-1,6-N-acetyl-D-glucosamine biosynthesis protein PgaD [Methylococcaceae bacterium]|jgi:poly-beta-1,6-N-acetyl-D-glucosamine biosynthesis protein PgaD|nr:poly-beta-1,6-N-acetyl-D-glucosamine biosynthesis protein PgaD [Methylococcaceae bacterium]